MDEVVGFGEALPEDYLNWRANLDCWRIRWEQQQTMRGIDQHEDSSLSVAQSLRNAGAEFNDWREQAIGLRPMPAKPIDTAVNASSSRPIGVLTSSWRDRETKLWRSDANDENAPTDVKAVDEWNMAVTLNRKVVRSARQQREDRNAMLARASNLVQLECKAEVAAKTAQELRSQLEKERLDAKSSRLKNHLDVVRDV